MAPVVAAPAGPARAAQAEFEAHAPVSDHRSPLRFILSNIFRHPLFGVLMIVGAFANAALAAAVPYFIGQAFNAVSRGEGLGAVVQFALAIIASQLLRAGLQLTRNFSAEVFAQRIERDVRAELYTNLLGKSMTFHDMQPVGEIMARVTNDVRELNLMMNPGMNLLIGSGMFLIVPVFGALALHPLLIWPPLIFLVLYFVAQVLYVRALNPIARRVRSSFGEMNADVEEVLEGLPVVKGAATEGRERAKFDVLVDRVRQSIIRQYDIEALYVPVLLLGLVIFAALAVAVGLYLEGEIDTGAVIAYIGQITLFGFPVFSSLGSISQVALGYASAERILNIINTTADLDQKTEGYRGTMRGEITFEQVDFRYREGDQLTLSDVSFHVPEGKTVAIVGQTGAGKSTLTKLLNRVYDTERGRVLVDGVDVRDWDLAALRSQISMIEQDIYLYSRSIADNIRFGKADATMDEVIEAAQKAQAHEFIMAFEQGYETLVGQRGVTLSGGQRQRLAIARAFVTNPPILVLDDSTSAIDSATEDKIQQAIWTAAKGRTTLLITHRLSQIRWADHIIVLKHGRVAAQGTHDDLMRTSEAYQRIFARYEGVRSDAAAGAAAHPPLHDGPTHSTTRAQAEG
jgi:ATP-binding cassette subfamily B protein